MGWLKMFVRIDRLNLRVSDLDFDLRRARELTESISNELMGTEVCMI